MKLKEDAIILVYGLLCLVGGGVLEGITLFLLPTHYYGVGITGSHHYGTLPGILFLISGSLLIAGLASPIMYLIVKLIKKFKA